MKEADLPSPGIGSKAMHLRRTAANAISALQVTAPKYIGGIHPGTTQLQAFFAACSAAFNPVAVPTPVGFDYAPGITVLRQGQTYTSDFNIDALRPTPTVIYYVDPITGSNADTGLTAALALKDLSVALAKADVDEIRIVNLVADRVVRGVEGWNNVNVTRSVAVRNMTNFRYISAAASSTLPTFTPHATLANVYQSTTTLPEQMIDCGVKTVLTNPDTGEVLDVPSMFDRLGQRLSVAEVGATASSWFHDGTILYVRLADNRAPDILLVKVVAVANCRAGGTDNTTVFLEGIDFVGGNGVVNFSVANAAHTGRLYAKHCSAQGARPASNGFMVTGLITTRLVNCGAYNNGVDGFNYHGFSLPGTTSSPDFIEVGCVARGNGTVAGTSDNASTSHENTRGIRIGCTYINSGDRALIDINTTKTWNAGCFIGKALNGVDASVVSQDTAEMWFDGCTLGIGPNSSFEVATGTTIHHKNMGSPPHTGAGSFVTY